MEDNKKGKEIIVNIPYYAKLFRPKANDYVNELLGKKTRRIFDVPLSQYSEDELQKLIEYYEHCIETKYSFNLPENYNYTYNRIFRQLHAVGFDIDKALQESKVEINFKRDYLPINLTNDIEKILNSGFMYIHGRDKNYRPLIVMNPALFNESDIPFESWEKFETYMMEYLINNCLIPGTIENWNFIIDLGDLRMDKIPFKLKDLFNLTKFVYRCRLFKFFLLNMNSVFSLVWNIARLVMGPFMEAKACKVDANDGSYDLLFQFINRSQVEKKYGGTAENLKEGEYYPPKYLGDNYFCNDKCNDEEIEKNIDYIQDYDSNEIFYEAESIS